MAKGIEDLQFYGPWALVSGASNGIGRALSRELAFYGYNLIIQGRNESRLQNLTDELHKTGIETKTVVCDLSGEEGIELLLNACEGMNIGLAILCAGFGTSGYFRESSLTEEINMVDVNISAVLTLSHHFANRFTAQRRGGIVLMSSLVAFQGVPYAANYAATKAYVQSLAEGLRRELKPHGVEVLAAAPGPVESGFSQRAGMKMGFALSPEDVAKPILKSLGKRGTVVPGWLSKLLVYSLKTAPRSIKVRIMQKVMGDMAQIS